MAHLDWLDCSTSDGGYVRVWARVDKSGVAHFVEGEVAQGLGKKGAENHTPGDGTSDVHVWQWGTGLSWQEVRGLFEMGAAYDRDPELWEEVYR